MDSLACRRSARNIALCCRGRGAERLRLLQLHDDKLWRETVERNTSYISQRQIVATVAVTVSVAHSAILGHVCTGKTNAVQAAFRLPVATCSSLHPAGCYKAYINHKVCRCSGCCCCGCCCCRRVSVLGQGTKPCAKVHCDKQLWVYASSCSKGGGVCPKIMSHARVSKLGFIVSGSPNSLVK